MSFLRRDEVDPEVIRVRAPGRLDAIDADYSGETILVYKRRTGIHSRHFAKVFQGYPIAGLREVLHFDLTRFVRKMENPKQRFYVVDGKRCSMVQGQRVYYLNLVIRFQLGNESECHHYRFVMTRGGIKHVERLP